MTEKQQIQAEIYKLQERLDKCGEVEQFTCKGDWYTISNGIAFKNKEGYDKTTSFFEYWQTKEIAEKAYQLQLRHRKMLSFVSQHQELDKGHHCIVNDGDRWGISTRVNRYPDQVMMTKETADLMLEAIENGSLDLG